MKILDKILLMWLAFMWIIFSIWVIAINPFPFNFGFVAFQFLTGIILVWTMKPLSVKNQVPSE